MQKQDDIVIIGAGNVATHLAQALHHAGFRISQVWSRHAASAAFIAEKVGAKVVQSLSDIQPVATLYLFTVKDDAYEDILAQLPLLNGAAVHTSGTLSIEILKPYFKEYGVWYPLQTFSKEKPIDIATIPFVIHASSEAFQQRLISMTQKLNADFQLLNDFQRKQLHISAVIANNFANHLWKLAFDFSEKNGIPSEIFQSLLKESLSKAIAIGPKKAQTGPAVRGDVALVQQHIDALNAANETHLATIYKQLSESIMNDKEIS